jgi:SAM-dependent methyltransferase
MLKNIFNSLFVSAEKQNTRNVCFALSSTGPHQILLDVGCWDGLNSLIWAKAASAVTINGIEPVKTAAKKAIKRKINVANIIADKGKWPFDNNSIDCIVTNQVVEHLTNLDNFFKESSRTLKSNGYLIVSTNNLSSWHNIFSLIFGWAPFDLTNASEIKSGVGNPLAIHRGESNIWGSSWTHKCIYTSTWLSAWGNLYGFDRQSELGAGYYPLPNFLGNLDKTHCALMTIIFKKII